MKVTSSLGENEATDTLADGVEQLMRLLSARNKGDDEKPTDVPASTSPKLIVDTGTTYFTAAGELYHIIRKKLPDAKCSETVKYPDLVYTLKDVEGTQQKIRIPASEYMVSDFGDWCTA